MLCKKIIWRSKHAIIKDYSFPLNKCIFPIPVNGWIFKTICSDIQSICKNTNSAMLPIYIIH